MWRKDFNKHQLQKVPGAEKMISRQGHILRILSSIAVGIMALCLTVPAAMLFGGILFHPWLKSDILFPPQLAILIMSSTGIGLVIGIVAGTKYFRYLGKSDVQGFM